MFHCVYLQVGIGVTRANRSEEGSIDKRRKAQYKRRRDGVEPEVGRRGKLIRIII